jgi:copper oxidase (laccase) domain-containing protein
MVTADCFPVIVYEKKLRALALIHASRESTDRQVIINTLGIMENKLGINPANLEVVLGPGIDKKSYTKREFPQLKKPEWREFIDKSDDKEYEIDLKGMIIKQLLLGGIEKLKIKDVAKDTFTDSDYFSHRRSVANNETEGRFATIVGFEK